MIGASLPLVAAIAVAAGPDGGAAARCNAGEVVWAGQCLERGAWLPDEARCRDGVVQVPNGEDKARCVRCEDVEQQRPLNYCTGVRAARADRELGALYEALMADFPGHAADLRDAESAWVRKRDKACAAAEKKYEGGTIAPQIHGDCMYHRTRTRMKELKALRHEWSRS